jgi:cytochrome c553
LIRASIKTKTSRKRDGLPGAQTRLRSLRKADYGNDDMRGAAMRNVFVGALSVAILCGSFAHAADTAAGKDKAELCAGCHGEAGISQTENIPSLAGQPDQFIQWQLVFFRGGSRKNEQMQPIVEQISNDDIRSLGAYFASLTPPKAATPDDNTDLSKKGAQAAAGRRCASCHTDSYAGTKAVARIAGQREDYLLKALHDYKSGQRSGGGGAAMAEVAYPLSEEEITALAHYLAHL